MAITHKNNLPLVMDLNVSQAYATSVSPKIWRCRWAGYTAIIVTCGKHNCCLFWVKRARGNIIQTWGKRTNTDRNVSPTPGVACVNLGVEQQTQMLRKPNNNQNHSHPSSGINIRTEWSLKDVHKKFRAIYKTFSKRFVTFPIWVL